MATRLDNTMTEHTCHAYGCTTPVPRRMFMCRPHWFALPPTMRRAVNATYTPGQEHHLERVSRAYLDATRTAINWLRDR